ncbi:MAG: transglycosylase SLT domain-containing protein [Deltaproteobacteria bacterium]|nr:transglycosylase SLT domain-containing protein [Deltaproteobacteria bacterium]
MASIFHTSYEINMARIASKSKHSRLSEPDTKNQPKSFADLLVEQQNPSNVAKLLPEASAKEMPPSPICMVEKESRPVGETLSNFTLGEKERSLNKEIENTSHIASKPIIDAKSLKAVSYGVKNENYEVKSPPPPPAIKLPFSAEDLEESSEQQIKDMREQFKVEKREFSLDHLRNIIMSSGMQHGVDPQLGLAVAAAESSFRTDAVSKDGHETKGLFQLLDSTASDMLKHLNLDKPYDAFNPELNSNLGVGYLRLLHDTFSKETALTSEMKTYPAISADDLEKLAVAAFNTGQGNVARAQEKARARGENPGNFSAVEPHLSLNTQRYVKRVMGFKQNA